MRKTALVSYTVCGNVMYEHLEKYKVGNSFIDPLHWFLDTTFRQKSFFFEEGDEFFFTAKPKKNGYISLLTVYENGVVTVLLPNIEVKANETMRSEDEWLL